jgi:two-component system CheB/CheR fusion protein
MATPDAETSGVGAVRVQPFTTGRAGSRFLVITFERALGQGSSSAGAATSVSDEAAKQIADLQRELLFVRESLQATIEQLETVNEELQASNEELLASNEELQSTNEEQQSANEELKSVNTEYQVKMTELGLVNADLDNLFIATSVGTLFLDEKLRVRRFSKSITEQFSLLDRDIGRPIEDITHRFKDLRFADDLRQVQDTAQILEREVTTAGGQHFLLKMSPFFTPEKQVRGVVATFVEDTGLRTEQETRARLQYVIDSLPEQVAVVGRDGVIRFVNRAWSEFARANGGAGLEARGGVGANYLDACRSVPDIRAAIEAVMLGSRERFSVEYPCHSPTLQRWFVMHVGRMGDGSGVVISHIDVSAQRSAGGAPS